MEERANTGDGRELRKLAVFDFDGTCIDGQSGSLFTLYLFFHHYLGIARSLRLGWWGLRYTLHLPYRQDEPREVIFAVLGEHAPDEVSQLMSDFHDQVLVKRYRTDALDEIRRRHEEGCITLLVSATFTGIAARAARYLGVDAFIATEMEKDADGNYTGRVKGDVVAGPEKCAVVTRWADAHVGPGRWQLAYAYGDHHTDENLLAAARKPFAVCPGRTLRTEARKRGWEILEWN